MDYREEGNFSAEPDKTLQKAEQTQGFNMLMWPHVSGSLVIRFICDLDRRDVGQNGGAEQRSP